MTKDELIAEGQTLGRWERHKFLALVGMTIVISLFLVGIALGLYNSSGAAQLDLSRPSYAAVRSQAVRTDTVSTFSSTGPINKSVLDQFRSQYDAQAQNATTIDSFGGNVMTDQELAIDDPATATPATN